MDSRTTRIAVPLLMALLALLIAWRQYSGLAASQNVPTFEIAIHH